jgi:hypothetical protein
MARGLQSQYAYAALIQKVFDPKYWAAPGKYRHRRQRMA